MSLLDNIIFGLISVLIGVAVSYGVYFLLDRAVGLLPSKVQERIRFLAFILPAAVLVVVVLLYPLVDTVVLSFMNSGSTRFIGFDNYAHIFTNPEFFGILFNNFLWIAFVPAVTVGIGLLFATLTNLSLIHI